MFTNNLFSRQRIQIIVVPFFLALFYDTLFTNVFGISNATIAAEKMLEKSSETSTENVTRNEKDISNPETEIDNVDKKEEKSKKETLMSSGQGKVILGELYI
jgi:hypothetical protein